KYLKLKYVVKKGNSLNSCTSCGGVSRDIIKRFLTADTAATNVIARSLYEMIPGNIKLNLPESQTDTDDEDDWFEEDNWFEGDSTNDEKSNNIKEISNPRKLLIFSDNRQEAAFFASYMNDKYNQILWRKIILKALYEQKNSGDEILNPDEIIRRMVRIAGENNVFEENADKSEKNKIASTYLIKEIISIERNTGLEGLGIISINYDIPKLNKGFDKLNLSTEEFNALINIIIDSYRYQSALSFPSNIIQTDEAFEPRNREVYFRLEDGDIAKDKTVLSQLPKEKSENRRSNFIKRILIKNGVSKDEAKIKAKNILKEITVKIDERFIKKGIFQQFEVKPFGIVKRVDYKKICLSLGNNSKSLYICNRCGKVTSNNIKNLCPEFRCEGELVDFNSNQTNKYKYYRELYDDLDLKPMIAKEHTAQLTSTTASNLQKRFEEGKINVLSCSTTFEMGVDVGQLEAILMRNVPPETSNYIQRAGRAGRRGSSTAFVVTFARRRSHDLNYFKQPEKMISGLIKAPYLETKNERIVKRHMNSVIFAYFFKKRPELFRNTANLFLEGNENYASNALKELLKEHPSELIDGLVKIVPKELHDKLKLNNWEFVEELCGNEGYFTRVENEYRNNITELNLLREERFFNNQKIDYIDRIINTYKDKSNINYLSDRNILPKYGFPVDVVSLDILNNDMCAKEIDISRDLKMAISEFAPGCSVVANGKVWTSYSINQESKKGWPTFDYAICDKCKKIHTNLSDISSKRDE
ncbi:helicase-related protein, partial [Clostridium sp.]|uniref:helicase-related protein n=1 Tax=Clostridium sp. TaxID=1506 RepID=UPI0026114EE0